MDYQMLAIVLLFAGLALMIAEFFIPSGGMIAVICIICLVTSIWAAYKAWWPSSYFWIYMVSLLALVPTALFGLIKLLETTSLGNRVMLTAPDQRDVTPYQAEQVRLQALVGKTARTVTQFNPGGMLVIEGEGERLHAFSEGLLIPSGELVEISEVRGNRLLVRPTIRGKLRDSICLWKNRPNIRPRCRKTPRPAPNRSRRSTPSAFPTTTPTRAM